MAKLRVIYGFHAVRSALRRDNTQFEEIYVDASRKDPRSRELLEFAEQRHVRVMSVEGERLDGLTGGARHQGVVAKILDTPLSLDLDEILDQATEPAFLLVLDGVQDPHNLGACLRVADAMGVHAVIAPKDNSVGITSIVSKVASGAAETVPYIMVTNLARTLRDLKDRNIWFIGADESGDQDLHQADLSGPMGLVLGAEGKGLRRLTRDLCDRTVRIPMFGSVESLNVSVATGICLYEVRRQRANANLGR
jgi:23S rRNA (guanosine2251-2'-O)-methyltransferase